MKITKFGHCCMLVEEKDLRILFDPGIYSTKQNELQNIDLILITHTHSDHFDLDSIKKMLKNNPNAKIITNSEVGKELEKAAIPFSILEHGQKMQVKGIRIEAIGNDHAYLHHSIPCLQNTGYLIANRFFFPGDALTIPKNQTIFRRPFFKRPIEILALPVAGPWLKLEEAIEYAKEIKPKICFPVHDGGLKHIGSTNRIPPIVLEPLGITFKVLELEKENEF